MSARLIPLVPRFIPDEDDPLEIRRRAFQEHHGHLSIPIRDPQPPELAKMMEKCLLITGSFEGCGWGALSGDFDEQGMSLGILQWCLGQSSLQPMLREYLAGHKAQLNALWGPDCVADLESMLANRATPSQVAWARKKLGGAEKPKGPWADRFRQLAKLPEYIEVQKKYAMNVFNRALALVKTWSLSTERAAAFCFDTVTQQGGIGDRHAPRIRERLKAAETAKGTPLTEKEQMECMARGRTEFSIPRWQADVLARRLAIIRGSSSPFSWKDRQYSGYVHGESRRIDVEFSLTDTPLPA